MLSKPVRKRNALSMRYDTPYKIVIRDVSILPVGGSDKRRFGWRALARQALELGHERHGHLTGGWNAVALLESPNRGPGALA